MESIELRINKGVMSALSTLGIYARTNFMWAITELSENRFNYESWLRDNSLRYNELQELQVFKIYEGIYRNGNVDLHYRYNSGEPIGSITTRSWGHSYIRITRVTLAT